MKKRIMITVMLVCVLSMLCACGHSHEWTEASCLVPKTCSECGETQGTELGHEFAAAVCDAPMTCSRCGATEGEALEHHWSTASCAAAATCDICGTTQGEALPHDFGGWKITGENMTRKCAVCKNSETVAVDREVYVMNQMAGFWDYYGRFYGEEYEKFRSAQNGSSVNSYVQVSDEGEFVIELYEEQFILQFEFSEYTDDGEKDVYYFDLKNEELTNRAYFLDAPGEEDDVLAIFSSAVQKLGSQEYMFVYQKNQQIVDYMTGTWACYEDGRLYTLQMNDDRTFTSDFDGEISGTWHIKPLHEDALGTPTVGVVFRYVKDGVTVEESSAYDWNDSGIHNGLMNIVDDESGQFYGFTYMSEDDLAKLEAVAAEGPERKIVGEWIVYESAAPGETRENDDSGYSAVFRDDGTFTLMLAEEKTGTWELAECRYHGNDGELEYIYKVMVDGESEENYWYVDEEYGLQIWVVIRGIEMFYAFRLTE